MDPYATLKLAGTVLAHWAALVGVASVIVHSRVPWRATAMGRHLMAYMASIAAVFVLVCIANDVGDSVPFQVLRLLAFFTVPLVMTQRLVLQLRAYRARDNEDDPAR